MALVVHGVVVVVAEVRPLDDLALEVLVVVVHPGVDHRDHHVGVARGHVPGLLGLDLGEAPELVEHGVVDGRLGLEIGRMVDVVGLGVHDVRVAPELGERLGDARAAGDRVEGGVAEALDGLHHAHALDRAHGLPLLDLDDHTVGGVLGARVGRRIEPGHVGRHGAGGLGAGRQRATTRQAAHREGRRETANRAGIKSHQMRLLLFGIGEQKHPQPRLTRGPKRKHRSNMGLEPLRY
ncbi:hypothetical protein D3C86_1405600 [compost metagenome]